MEDPQPASPSPASRSPRLLIRQPGAVRGVYLWAGDATIDLQRVKFPDRPVDEDAHRLAHGREAAEQLSDSGFTWAFLSMNWGFPPELETAHWAQFQEAARRYRDAGLRVLGYVQASNCVARGSYARKDWYARTWRGAHVPYFRDRLMTCWNHSEWVAEVSGHAVRAMDLGADGVFFDNVWMGATPWVLGLRVGGFAGCACARCRTRFEEETGLEIPRALRDDPTSGRYLEWRASVVEKRLRQWTGQVRVRYPEAVITANSCDAALRDTRGLFGYDLRAASRVQDALLVENVAMPRYDRARRRLVANALALKAVQATAPDRPVLGITYESGIGLDAAPDSRRLRRGIAEMLAVGAAPVVKGSEYLDSRGRFSVLTATDFAATREAAAGLLRWAAANPALFGAEPDPDVEVLLEDTGAPWAWAEATPQVYALALSLICNSISFRFTRRRDRHVLTAEMPPARALRLAHHPWVRAAAHPFLSLFTRLYFSIARVRRLVDATGLTRWFLRSPLFDLPAGPVPVHERIGERRMPWVTAEGPVLAERYRASGRTLLHLVNYGDQPVRVVVHDDRPAGLYTPDGATRWVWEVPWIPPTLRLDTYAVLVWAAEDSA